MNKPAFTEVPWPIYNKDQAGKYYIQPLEMTVAKGYRWTWSITFELESSIAECAGKVFALRHWAKPKLELTKHEIRLANGKLCNCKDCKLGRKQVKAGWLPR